MVSWISLIRSIPERMPSVQPGSSDSKWDPTNWFDCAHTHVDWDGVGNRSAAARRPFLEALFITFERLQQQALRCPHPYQSWIYIQDDDSSQAPVSFHTKKTETRR